MYAQASYDAKTANFLKKNEDYINKTPTKYVADG